MSSKKSHTTLERVPALNPTGEFAASGETLVCRLAIYQGLVRVSALINSITDFEAMLEAVIGVSRDVFDAEAASLFLPSQGGQSLHLAIASSGEGFEKPQIDVPRGRGVAWWVWENLEPVLIPDAYSDPRFYREADKQTGFRTRSILSAPLVHEGTPVAVLQVINPRNKPAFDSADLEAITGYSSLLATALEKLRALEAQRKDEVLHRDLTIAAEIQQSLLARAISPALPDGRVFAVNRPAFEVGGDFYYLTRNSRGDNWFAIGDVSGKGIAAALLMTQTMDALRFLLRGRASPAQMLFRLNNMLHEISIRGMFVTILLGRERGDNGKIEISSGGHCKPWILPASGSPQEWDVAGGLPAGIMPNAKFHQTSITVHPGDALLLFTDGLSESREANGSRQFIEILPEILSCAPRSPEALAQFIVEKEVAFRGDFPPRDDLTILALCNP